MRGRPPGPGWPAYHSTQVGHRATVGARARCRITYKAQVRGTVGAGWYTFCVHYLSKSRTTNRHDVVVHNRTVVWDGMKEVPPGATDGTPFAMARGLTSPSKPSRGWWRRGSAELPWSGPAWSAPTACSPVLMTGAPQSQSHLTSRATPLVSSRSTWLRWSRTLLAARGPRRDVMPSRRVTRAHERTHVLVYL